jgi:hypothetical protein
MPQAEFVTGEVLGKRELGCDGVFSVPYRGKLLAGTSLKSQLDKWFVLHGLFSANLFSWVLTCKSCG